MPQVTAAIVVSQADNAAPGGYASGSRDDLLLAKLITLTNASNTGATSWTWEIFPAVGLAEGDYSVAGKAAASCTLTPPAATGYGDLAVRLTVRGDPLPGGRPNVAIAEALLGVRASLDGYEDGLPLVHPHEGTLGGKLTFSLTRGVTGRLAEAVRAILLALAGVGGSDDLWGASVDGDRTESGGGAATALTQPRFYNDLTLSNATTLSMAGYRLHVADTLTVGEDCALHHDGGAASGQTAGTGAAAGELALAAVGGVNGAAINSSGSGAAAAAASPAVGGPGGAGGAASPGGAGGAASTVTLTVTSHGIPWSRLGLELLVCIYAGTTFQKFRGGAGGAGGGGSTTAVGGGGGGGGGLGWTRARHVVNNGRISCRGGAGGVAGTNGGGGGGGGGGLLVIWCETWTGSPPDCDGGAGGAGNGGGVSGSQGSEGKCLVFVKGVLKYRSGFGANAPDIDELAA